jgi:hypothetical protein
MTLIFKGPLIKGTLAAETCNNVAITDKYVHTTEQEKLQGYCLNFVW